MMLQYGNTPFSLPKNLYIIGTMNTADRSIALVDLALRSRLPLPWHFILTSRPSKDSSAAGSTGTLPGCSGVEQVVASANRKLDDRHAAIGPSYFMREGLDEDRVRMIWEHNVLPYIEERLFGEPDGLKEFALDALRAETDPNDAGTAEPEAGEDGDAEA